MVVSLMKFTPHIWLRSPSLEVGFPMSMQSKDTHISESMTECENSISFGTNKLQGERFNWYPLNYLAQNPFINSETLGNLD